MKMQTLDELIAQLEQIREEEDGDVICWTNDEHGHDILLSENMVSCGQANSELSDDQLENLPFEIKPDTKVVKIGGY